MTDTSLSRQFSEAESRHLMERLWALLAEQTEKYTMGESTSVTVETAQELLHSLWYTLTLAAEEANIPQERLLTNDLPSLIEQGQEILRDKLEQTKKLWETVCCTAPPVQNVYYTDTLRGIGEYFKHYDLLYFAHQKPPCIDYPLLLPVSEAWEGITYAGQYLSSMLTENLLLRQFDAGAVRSVLRAAVTDYREHYLNLCEQPLANAVGLLLLGRDGQSPVLSSAEQAAIQNRLQRVKHEDRKKLLRAAAAALCDDMAIEDAGIRGYAVSFAVTLLPRLNAALDAGDISRVFIASEPV